MDSMQPITAASTSALQSHRAARALACAPSPSRHLEPDEGY